ncbi:hypothetical protein Bca52824_029324 [Brassica carinata]|uniref:Knottins-like domain-containing protein n=1 Tax=Brassica carinata TaxID=52824 RepID=A0A8X7VE35_BRACI|nr:hypothetical protein Bca52824_029324 [Brassica carinata]
MKMKSVSIFPVLFVFFLVVLESPEKIEAKFKCVEEYGGKTGTQCSTKFFPTLCRQNCRAMKGAKNGICIKKNKHTKCYCDFCKE